MLVQFDKVSFLQIISNVKTTLNRKFYVFFNIYFYLKRWSATNMYNHYDCAYFILFNNWLWLYVGILSPMSKIRTENDLGHPICQNLRDGDWLIEYITKRMALYRPLEKVSVCKTNFKSVCDVCTSMHNMYLLILYQHTCYIVSRNYSS